MPHMHWLGVRNAVDIRQQQAAFTAHAMHAA